MKRLIWIPIALIIYGLGIITQGVVQLAHAAQPPQVATVVAGTAYPPQDIAVFLGDQLYLCPQWHPSTTPTRIFTPTNFAETATPTLRPSATATPTVGVCRAGTVTASKLNVRAEANVNSKVLRVELLGSVLSLKTTTGTWLELCGGGFVSASWVKVQ